MRSCRICSRPRLLWLVGLALLGTAQVSCGGAPARGYAPRCPEGTYPVRDVRRPSVYPQAPAASPGPNDSASFDPETEASFLDCRAICPVGTAARMGMVQYEYPCGSETFGSTTRMVTCHGYRMALAACDPIGLMLPYSLPAQLQVPEPAPGANLGPTQPVRKTRAATRRRGWQPRPSTVPPTTAQRLP